MASDRSVYQNIQPNWGIIKPEFRQPKEPKPKEDLLFFNLEELSKSHKLTLVPIDSTES